MSIKTFFAFTIVALILVPVTTPAAAQSSSCDGIAGQWTITNVTAIRMTINPNGTGSFHTGVTFKWTCHGNSFVYTDSMMGITTRMTISSDRMHMVGAGTMGESMTAVRNSPLSTGKTTPPSGKPNRPSASHAPVARSGPVNGSSRQHICQAQLKADINERLRIWNENVADEEFPIAEYSREFMQRCLAGQDFPVGR